jgi:hypothetical protein
MFDGARLICSASDRGAVDWRSGHAGSAGKSNSSSGYNRQQNCTHGSCLLLVFHLEMPALLLAHAASTVDDDMT